MKVILSVVFALAVAIGALIIGNLSVSTVPADAGQSSELNSRHPETLVPDEKTEPSQTRRPAPAVRPTGSYIVIDRYCNKLFLRTADSVILEALCSTGSGGELIDSASGRRWEFATPAGVFVVDSKLKNPWWRKPDWAFIEEGEPMPKAEDERYDNEMMGDYAIGFGDGFFVHGTIYERLLGTAVTHGCVRLGAEDLKKLYDRTKMGTIIYVY